MSLFLVFEGDTDLPVVRKLAADARFEVALELDMGGKAGLDAGLPGYVGSAAGTPWFVLRDLDHDAPCAPDLLAAWKLKTAPWMCFRLAVREVESWLLADARGVASFFEVDPRHIPTSPDALENPTAALVDLSRRSKNGAIRKGMVPAKGANTRVGPSYEALVIEFGTNAWDLGRASRNSDSLARARHSLKTMGKRWRAYVGDSD